MAIGVTFLIGIAVFFGGANQNVNVLAGFFVAGILVGLVGFWDDRGHVSPKWRLLVHFLAAAWVLAWFGKIPLFTLYANHVMPVWFGYSISAVCLVWLLNLFNFMDGIDGIASVEAIFVAFSGFLFTHHSGLVDMQYVAIILLGSVLGFLIWNWPPAKIFMGDIGSGFLGVVLGGYAYWTMIENAVSFWAWLIIFGVFWIDATFTLLRRIFRRALWYEAHRSHAYQHAAHKWGHLRVTVVVSIINIAWLLPIAYFSNIYRHWGAELALVALTPIVVLVFLLGAGKELN